MEGKRGVTTKNAGTWGEAHVANYLRERGYRLLGSQWRCRFGEIDLIAQKQGVVCFVEVKLRSGGFGLPREAVDARKQQKLRTAAALYLSQYELDCPARFDVAEVYTDAAHSYAQIEYLEDAFT